MEKLTQYRVQFTADGNFGTGNVTTKACSTKWYDNECECAKWEHEPNARIVTRELEIPNKKPWESL